MIRLANLGISRKRLEGWEIRIETALQLDDNFVTGVTRRFYEEYKAKTIEEAVEKLVNTTLPVHYRVFVKRVIPPFRVDVDQPLWRTMGKFEAIPRGKIGHWFPWVSAPDSTEFVLAFLDSQEPLTLGELIRFIDESHHPDDCCEKEGLLKSHWSHMLSEGHDTEESFAFASIDSDFYPDLAAYYAEVADQWTVVIEAERRADGWYEEEDEEEDEEEPDT